MTESTGDAHLRSVEVPDFLTVEEAARVLRIGRAAGYREAHHFEDTPAAPLGSR